MGVSSGRSRVADLAFRAFAKALHPDWFAVRGFRRLGMDGWEADLRIIDGGHVISWRAGATALTEVLSGPETILPEPGLLLHAGVSRERIADLRPPGGLHYQACVEVERVDAEVFRHLSEELTLDAAPGDLFNRFTPKDRLAPSPISRIHAEARATGLSVQSFHTFPDERAIVRAQSLFEFRLGSGPR